jgi:hypothetical protein
MDKQIAKTILSQLGGNKFCAMTGAKTFVALEDGLMFAIPRAKNIRKVEIKLNGSDLYDVVFYSLRGVECKIVAMHSEVYADQLQAIFTQETGLYTSL